MLRRPVFWIAFAAFSLVCAVFTFKNFSVAFPLVSIDLQMNRGDALRQARSLAEKNGWPPQAFDQAAEFSGDQESQNFIELEGGGKPELARILKEKIFALYTWRVRHFKEADAHETLIRFTPAGEPYGFRVKLPDQEKGASKAVEEALRIAEDTAKSDWNIDFSRYQRIESSREVLPGGRTDHTFVYERQDERIREGRYRLRLVVGGDKLTELTHFVQIPEAFSRRYEQMRSANDAINAVDSVLLFALYILGFCGIGLFFMIRQHWVLWRQAAFWAVFIALLMGLAQLNAWPLAWMNYDTAVSASGFAIRQVMTAVAVFGAFVVLLTISFVAAETLSRRAFPYHVQLWKDWSPPVSSSPTVFGQTAAGYLLVAPFFAYEIILYFFAQEKLGWWTPSDSLVNPDLFANYLPSLSAIAMAAQAGFWEECLFRAVPLATAAILGEKFGKRRAFIAGGMILQALVFAAGHAGYANQPAYARVVELIIPSFAFGMLYLAFGLLPGIVLHFAYDTVWMALPLFVSSGLRAHIEQAIVVIVVAVPLLIVVRSRIRAGRWTEVPDDAWNGAWKPRLAVEEPVPAPAPVVTTTSMPSYVFRAVPIVGLLGLVIWTFATPFRTNVPPVTISRGEAERLARQTLVDRGIELDPSWTVLSHVEGQPGLDDRFVWQTAGEGRYEKLLRSYLMPPIWMVRFARFSGDVAERAEEYHVYIGDVGVFRVSHTLPEVAAAKSLTEAEARSLAVSALPGAANFSEVSAEASKRPARTDWTFDFKDTRDYGLPQGEPRIKTEIAGDEVADTSRYVYVPEDWQRTERARRNLTSILAGVCTVLVISIVAAGAVVGAIQWSRNRSFSARTFFAVFGTVFFAGVVTVVNSWPVFASGALTAQPLALQVGIALIASFVFGIFTAVGLGLVAGLVAGDIHTSSSLPIRNGILLGCSLGLGIAGATALVRHAIPPAGPLWGNLGPASAYLPIINAALAPLGGFFTQTVILLATLYAAYRWPRVSVIWLFVGIALGGLSIETIPSWLMIGATTGIALMLAYRLVFRHQPEVLLITTTTLVILSTIRDGIQRMYPAALAGLLIGVMLVALAGWVWFRGRVKEAAVH